MSYLNPEFLLLLLDLSPTIYVTLIWVANNSLGVLERQDRFLNYLLRDKGASLEKTEYPWYAKSEIYIFCKNGHRVAVRRHSWSVLGDFDASTISIASDKTKGMLLWISELGEAFETTQESLLARPLLRLTFFDRVYELLD